MGDIADMMLEGTLDEQTGEYIDGQSPGYPRTMEKGCYNTIKLLKTSDIKVGSTYIYEGEHVIVIKRIPGKLTNKPNMQSGILFIGNKRTQKKFELDNGKIVKAKTLFKII